MDRPWTPGWRPLGATDLRETIEAWRQLHWAAQIPAAFAAAALEARSDDSHLSLGWDEATGALVTHASGRWRAGLRLADLTLVLLDGPTAAAELALSGRGLDEGLAWARDTARRHLEKPPRAELVRQGWDMPDHPVSEGGAFDATARDAFEEVARWYADADLALGELARADRGASPVRCWPHHFDIATLVALGGERTIGIGLAPADDSLDEPYFYANPWPAPDDPSPPALDAGGEWHREGWFGAVLRATRLVGEDAAAQRPRLETFLRSAVAADRELLGEEE